MPTAQQATPASSTASGARRRVATAAITTANSRLSTSSGWTRVSDPRCRARIWSPAPARFTPMEARNNGRRTRSVSSRGDSAARCGTCLVLRCSSTDAAPNAAAAPSPGHTASTANITSPQRRNSSCFWRRSPVLILIAVAGRAGGRSRISAVPGRLPLRGSCRLALALVPGERFKRAVKPVPAWAPDLRAFQWPVGRADRVPVLDFGRQPAPPGAMRVQVGRTVQEHHRIAVHGFPPSAVPPPAPPRATPAVIQRRGGSAQQQAEVAFAR